MAESVICDALSSLPTTVAVKDMPSDLMAVCSSAHYLSFAMKYIFTILFFAALSGVLTVANAERPDPSNHSTQDIVHSSD